MALQETDLSILSKGGARAPQSQSKGLNSAGAKQSWESMPMPASRWKTRLLLPGAILACFAGIFLYALRDSLIPAVRVHTVPVIAKTAQGGGPSGVVAQAAGWIEPAPYPYYASALTDGIVKDVLVLEGQRVKAGDVVARLIDEDARLALDEAEAELKHDQHDVCDYEAGVKAAQAEWDNPVERTRAASIAAAILDQSRADVAANTTDAAVESAKVTELEEQYRREKVASDAGATAVTPTVLTKLKLETQRATLKALQGKRPSLEAKVRQQEAELKAAQDNLRLRIAEGRELEQAIAKLDAERHTLETVRVRRDMAKLRLARNEIRAPTDGVVMELLTEPGAKLYVNMNERNSAQVARLYDPAKLQVRVDVPLADAAKVAIGQSVKITVEVLRDIVFSGKVTRVVHQADISKNTLQFKVSVENPREELKPEMLARVQFIAMEKPGGKEMAPSLRLFAPDNLIHTFNGQSFTWICDKGHGTAIRRPVVLGNVKQEGWVEVVEGLQPGDALIEGDTSNFKDGQRVSVEADANDAQVPTPAASHETTMEQKH